MDTADIRRISTDQLVARSYPNFQVTKIISVLDKLAWRSPLILKGPKGAGKTVNLEQWASINKAPFLRKSCTADTSDRQLIGSHTLKSFDESFFTLGCLAGAIDVANEAGRCMLVLEEINALNEEAQKAVNSIADYRREIDIPHVGKVFRLREEVKAAQAGTLIELEQVNGYSTSLVVKNADGTITDHGLVPIAMLRPNVKEGMEIALDQVLVDRSQIWVTGTMNPGYGGTYDLNEDFRSRFKFIEVDFMDDKTEQAILHRPFAPKATAAEEVFVTRLQTMAKESRGGKYGYGLSTRDLEQCVEDLLAFKDEKLALKMLEGKFDAQYVTDFRALVKTTFKVDITATSFWT